MKPQDLREIRTRFFIKIISLFLILTVTVWSTPESSGREDRQLREPTVSKEEAELLKKVVESADEDQTEAIKLLLERMTSESSAALDFALGTLKLQQDDLKGAEEDYRSALKKFPDFDRARANLGRVLIMQGKNEEASQVFKTLLLEGKPRPETLTLIGYTFLLQGQSVPAEMAYRQALLLNPDDNDAYLGLAKSLLDQERYHESIRLLEDLLEKKPEKSELWFLLANADLALEKADQAIVKLECARRLGIASSESLATLGDLYMNRSQPDEALITYKEAFAGAEPSVGRLLRAAEGFIMMNLTSEAKTLLAKAQDIEKQKSDSFNPDQHRQFRRLEARLARLNGDLKAAVRAYLQLLEEDPLDGDALIALGDLHWEKGELEEAVITYERAARIPDKEAEALIKQAQVEVERERYGRAVELLETAQVFKPKPHVARYLEQVRRLVR